MKKTYNLIYLIFISIAFTTNVVAERPSYKTRADIEAEKMGSITDIDGFTFTPLRVKNESTKAPLQKNVNKFLWQASLEKLKFMPIANIDEQHGVIISDWYNKPGEKTKVFKVNIFITQDTISPSSIDVRVFSQTQGGSKIISSKEEIDSANLEKEILIYARSLYINSQQ